MNKLCKTLLISAVCTLLFHGISNAESNNTIDHSVGLSVVPAFNDVVDFYTDHPLLSEESATLPFGISYKATYNIENGFRFDAGVGPICMISGAVSYIDIPLNITAGYTFTPHNFFRPYLRGGLVYHSMSGDYITEEAGFGFTGAAGFEIGKRGRLSGFVELSFDTTETTFECHDYFYNATEKIKTNEFMLTAGVSF